jgi:hypothetical protein
MEVVFTVKMHIQDGDEGIDEALGIVDEIFDAYDCISVSGYADEMGDFTRYGKGSVKC